MTLLLGPVALLPAKAAVLPQARATSQTAEESEGEEGVIGVAKVDRADNPESGNDLLDREGEGAEVRVRAVAVAVVAAAVGRLSHLMRVQSTTTKRLRWTKTLPKTRAKQIF